MRFSIALLAIALISANYNLHAEALVGSLPGDVVVTNTGSATYSMPISLPAGMAGMTPELSINYDSTAGNGLLGMGFSLGGLSAISRTPTTLEQDRFTDGIDFDENDRFSLDGQRLVCISGNYGEAGSEYRTEIDSFIRVIAHGTATSGPDSFTVETKSGLTKTYGARTDAAMVYNLGGDSFDGAKVSWLLEQVEDTNGNIISYHYVQDAETQSKYISEIHYGAAGHQVNVVFEREVRTDKISSFLRGIDFSSSQRLLRIRILSSNTTFYDYELKYVYSLQRNVSQLTSVCYLNSASGGVMSSTFEWLDDVAVDGFSDKVRWYNSPQGAQNQPGWGNGDLSNLIDMNGDGLLDKVDHYSYDAGGGYGFWVSLNDGDVFVAKKRWYFSSAAAQNQLSWSNGDLSRLADMNGDGLLDKVDHYDYDSGGGSGLWVSLNNTDGFDAKHLWNQSSQGVQNQPGWSNGELSNLIDLNRDGLMDKVDHYDYDHGGGNGLWVSLSNANEPGFDEKSRWYYSSASQQNYTRWADGDLSKFIDMNGDGLMDKVDHYDYDHGGGSGLWVSLSNGDGFDSKVSWYHSPHQNAQDRPIWQHKGVVYSSLIDMNGDGLPDKVDNHDYDNGGGPGMWVRLNNGNGFDAKALWYHSNHWALNGPSWGDVSQLRDINGDGLPDKLDYYNFETNESGLWVSLNDGIKMGTKVLWYNSPQGAQNQPRWGSGDLSDLVDMNGDGLLDKVDHYSYDAAGGYGLWVSLNLGNGFAAKKRWYYSSAAEQNQLSWANGDLTRLVDINGDGFLDKVDHFDYDHGGGSGLWVSLNQSQPSLLKRVTNHLGVSTEIAYKPLTDSSVYLKGVHDATPPSVTIQTPMQVVSSITKDVGVDDANGAIPYVTEYTYTEARYHTHGRGFLGFRVFESYDVQTELTKTEILRHDFPFTGMVEASMTYGPNGQLLSLAENTLDALALNLVNGEAQTFYPVFTKSEEWKAEHDPAYVLPDTSLTDEEYELQLVTDLKAAAYGHTITANGTLNPDGRVGIIQQDNSVTFDGFDAHGNIRKIFIDYGDGYTQLTENTYAYDNEASWFLGRLSAATVTSTAPNTTTQDETIIRSSSFTYDSNGLLWTETVEPDNVLAVTTTYTRDAQGRIVSTSVDPADGPAIVTETHSVLDPTGRFYTKTTNALGHSETRVYDSIRGWVDSQTGPNGRTTHFTYDALGRAVREDRPDGTWSATTYAYDNSQTVTNDITGLSTTSVYSVTTTASQAPSATTWYDRLGRAIRACSEGFDGQIVYQDTCYNALGQVDRVSENYYADAAPTRWTESTFDEIGRPLVVTAPDGTKATTIFNGRTTTSISNYQGTDTINPNANNHTTVTELNAKGDKQTVTSYNQDNDPLVLTFRYDGVGNLLETEDSEGNIVSMTYDKRGNKVAMDDPDMGHWDYTYNALGQLVSQEDAVGNISSRLYDVLGRITEESYDAADTNIATVTHNYYYDGTSEHQQIGKLHLEKSSTGFRRSHYYDDLGRAFLTLSKIEGRWFYQQTDYDSYSRPVRLTHYWRPPSLDDAAHDHYLAWYSYSQETLYDDRSFVTEVRDANGQTWWSSPTYNQHGQLTSYLAGNDLTTTTAYNDANHVVERITVTPAAASGSLLDHRYQFDSIGNLTQRTDEVKGLTEDLFYDKLNRLTEATVAGAGTVAVNYDDLGNITNRTSTSGLGHVGAYDYFAGTHRVDNAGGRAFGYNDNGAITTVTGSSTGSITWAAFNKPYSMTSESKRSVFSYDTGNSRVTQTREEFDIAGSQWLTKSRKTYVGALFEQEQAWSGAGAAATPTEHGEPAKWDITSTRIYISTPAGVVGSWIDDVSQSAPTKTIFHRDHLGSVIAESDFNTPVAQITKQFSYDAWGLARDANDWHEAPAAAPERKATDRGFTGHEMLDALGLIHMNGRIYDPLLGRFLSADPNIQSPSNLQNYNRYSYVLNNPVSMTDPSGFFFKKLFKKIKKFVKTYWKAIVVVALAAITGGWALALANTWQWGGIAAAAFGGAVGGFTGGFVGSLLNGGKIMDALKAGAMGGVTGAVTSAMTAKFLSVLHSRITSANKMDGDLYLVKNGKATLIDPKSVNGTGGKIWINGQSNGLYIDPNGQVVGKALELGKIYTGGQDFYMIHNPTTSGFADTVESMLGKVTGQSPISKSTSNILSNFDLTNSEIYTHSQGGIITRNALVMSAAAGQDLSGLKTYFDGAAVNSLSTKVLFKSLGVNMVRFRTHSLDAVPNLIGYNALTIPNPFRAVGSVIASPLLGVGGEWSPHTFPGGGQHLRFVPDLY